MFDNSNIQDGIEWGNIELPGLSDEKLHSTNWNLHWKKTDNQKKQISNTLKNKSFDERVGLENANAGRISRSNKLKGKKRPKIIGEKTSNTRRENGSYDGRSMRGKEHKDSTKEIMAQKAKVRQDLKRRLSLGKNDSVPKDLLIEEYKKLGLQ